MLRYALAAGLSVPAVIFGLVVPAVIFLVIIVFFKLIFFLFRTLRDKRLERAYLAEKCARAEKAESEKNNDGEDQ